MEQEDGSFVSADIDTDANALMRSAWGLFRDRRPALYGPLLQLGATGRL
jgi:N-carbamoylputrescine amidase